MAYRDQLYPWCIVRLASTNPSTHSSTVVARFRRRGDAEAHLRILRQTTPKISFSILFEKVPAEATSAEAVTDEGSIDEDEIDKSC